MNISLKNFNQSFRLFINGSGKYILFTSLFYALWLVNALVINQKFDLHSFSGRMIGIATLEDYDIAARVSLFYKSIGVLFCSFALFTLAGFFLEKKTSFIFPCVEIKIINYTSILGILFLLFNVFNYKVADTFELVYFIHKLMLGALLLKLLFFKTTRLTIYTYTLIVLLAVSFYFFIADIWLFVEQSNYPDFLMTTFILCVLLIVAASIIQKKSNDNTQQKRLDVLGYVLIPLAFLPFLSILKDELYLVLTKREVIAFETPFMIYLLLNLLLISTIWLRYKKSKKAIVPNQKTLASNYYFPLVIFSVVSFINYNHVINYSDEMFEAANKYLAVMEFDLKGVIPTLEKFNSHLLSDYFFSAIYAFFNGVGDDMQVYEFLYMSFSCVLYYYLVYYISRNIFVAAFSILLLPFCNAMLPEQYALGILALFALHKLINGEASLKKYIFFFLTLAFLILWRIDLGYACLLIMSATLLYYHFFSSHFKINWALLFKSITIILLGSILSLGALSFYRNVNLFKKLINTLNYLTSAQTYGYPTIGDLETTIFKMHYFVFPIVVSLILLALVIKFKSYTKSKQHRLAYLALFFACGFYLMNFNRGLVRHGLTEWIDHFTASYLYLIIPISTFVFFRNKTQVTKFICFCAIGFFMLIHYKLPDPKGSKSYMELFLEKTQLSGYEDLSKIKTRIKNKTDYETKRNAAFVEFIKKNTTGSETFIDFSNNPMLYFYTQKITPSFFYQNPICSHNDYLQNVFISDLKDYDCPFVLFSRHDELSRDYIDNVPNTLRHYKIAEYLFQHYQPYLLAGQFGIWKRNDVKNQNPKRILYSYTQQNNALSSDTLNTAAFKANLAKKHFMKVSFKKNTIVEPTIMSGNSPVTYTFECISDTLLYAVIEPKQTNCTIAFNTKNITALELEEYDYLPNYLPEKISSYDYKKLPYMWGTFDKKVNKEAVLYEENINKTILSYNPLVLAIDERLDKTSGNTILIHCKNENFETQKLTLFISNKKTKTRSSVSFDLPGTQKEEIYALRISSMHKWYSGDINKIEIVSDRDNGIYISKIKITKGS